MMLNCFICLMISGAREQRNSIRPDSPNWKWRKETDQMLERTGSGSASLFDGVLMD